MRVACQGLFCLVAFKIDSRILERRYSGDAMTVNGDISPSPAIAAGLLHFHVLCFARCIVVGYLCLNLCHALAEMASAGLVIVADGFCHCVWAGCCGWGRFVVCMADRVRIG